MLLERYDDKKYERSLREEGRADERARISKLTTTLLAQGRIDDLQRAAEDSAYLERMLWEFGL